MATEWGGLFAADGPLARGIDGYAPREVQARMAQAVADAFESQDTLVVEAGTGTGKTFAYLVPALLSGRRTVLSTGTLNLQDQLFYRDLPRVRDALKAGSRVALLKGRANYLCHHRLERALQGPVPRHEQRTLDRVAHWARSTETGELQELSNLAEDDPVIPRVTSTVDNCLGQKCADFERCFVVQARRNAQAADVLVVNHHLLFADFAVREEGFGRILPGADAVVVDEAHQLPEIATRFFGARLSTRQLLDLASDAGTEAARLGDLQGLRDASANLGEAIAGMERTFSAVESRERLEVFLRRPGTAAALASLREALAKLTEHLTPVADRTPELAACAARAGVATEHLDRLDDGGEGRVSWVEAMGRGGTIHTTPVRVDDDFQRVRETHPGAWVFTSATLATGEDFSHFREQLGLGDARTLKLDSPFDFERQARLYLPQGLPDPGQPEYTEAVVEVVRPLIEASGGGAFVLCTSHRAVRLVSQRLAGTLGDLPLFVQGEGSRRQLLDAFTASGNGVLVGTSSFWEGVDVRGLALRLVIIDKLPFASPGDPVYEARLNAIRELGEDPFTSYQLPQAIMSLRQGVGRLIRDPADRGLLVLCDPRLRSRPYGRRILDSLPAMPEVESLDEARQWLREVRA